ncbi:DUF6879 family protein [Amycolatopsis samaneae]|uniref:DUF6879 family protein n=1 Tax=Amycolatopsis samaneae TaxID=664691 RepID=A0ABW5GCY8_9PSEU
MVGDIYHEEFGKDLWRTGAPGLWKLERRQTFQEPYSESWTAFRNGDWEEALRLHEARRASLQDTYRKIVEHGFSTWWVRVVEKPITPYLQWELHLLRLRNQCGDHVRAVRPEQVEWFERDGPLPEVVTLGTDVMYEIVYDENGLPQGGVRFTDQARVVRTQERIQELFTAGEDMETFFEREVAGLAPPSGG